MNLRREAMGKECQVRYEGICNGDPATTVLAHVRLIGMSGLGIKSPDVLGAWCCSSCHAYADTHHDAQSKATFYEGFIRTLAELLKRNLVKS